MKTPVLSPGPMYRAKCGGWMSVIPVMVRWAQESYFIVCERVLEINMEVWGRAGQGRDAQHQIRLSPREYVARAVVGYSGKKCHWHTAGRPELDTGKRVQGRDAEFPTWTPSWPLTAWAWLA